MIILICWLFSPLIIWIVFWTVRNVVTVTQSPKWHLHIALFCPANSPNLNIIFKKIHSNNLKEKPQIPTFAKLEPWNVFIWYQNTCQLISCQSTNWLLDWLFQLYLYILLVCPSEVSWSGMKRRRLKYHKFVFKSSTYIPLLPSAETCRGPHKVQWCVHDMDLRTDISGTCEPLVAEMHFLFMILKKNRTTFDHKMTEPIADIPPLPYYHELFSHWKQSHTVEICTKDVLRDSAPSGTDKPHYLKHECHKLKSLLAFRSQIIAPRSFFPNKACASYTLS